MISEPLQDRACLYVLGELSAWETKAFEQLLRMDKEVRSFTAALQNPAAALAAAAALPPSPDLRAAILAALPDARSVPAPQFGGGRWAGAGLLAGAPWALAACAAVAACLLYNQLSIARRSLSLESARSLAAGGQIELLRHELENLRAEDRVSKLRIALLASLVESAPPLSAVSLWDAERQDGVLVVQHLPPQPPEMDYQLWIIDPAQKAPIDAGVFRVSASGEVHYRFKPQSTGLHPGQFAVTIEKRGGVPAPAGKMVLAGSWL